MEWLRPIALIVAGVLAASGFIISKNKNAKQAIDKLVPFQGFIGVALLAWGVWDVIWVIRNATAIGRQGDAYPLYGISLYAAVALEILLGFLLGMPLIAKWLPGESAAETRALEMQKKVAGFNTLLGLLGIGVAVLLIYYNLKF